MSTSTTTMSSSTPPTTQPTVPSPVVSPVTAPATSIPNIPASSSTSALAGAQSSTVSTAQTTSSSGVLVPHRHHKRYSLSALGCQRLGIIPPTGTNTQRHSMEISGMLDPPASSEQDSGSSVLTLAASTTTVTVTSSSDVKMTRPVTVCVQAVTTAVSGDSNIGVVRIGNNLPAM